MDTIVKPAMSNPVGFWRRLGGGFLDILIIGVPIFCIWWFIGIREKNYLPSLIYTLYHVLVPIFWNGYTIGKKIMGIRIVNLDHSDVRFGTMLLRVVIGLHLAIFLTFGIAAIVSAIMVGVREDKRAIHDLIAGTYVTSD
ncbi:RDD family protein [Brevibacillus ruminantium]|uniref:RDD family protein n=1 Tax=Brevibacillus ruminantium TaxID=2950604 RepID=A0ABY4WLW6_9BACL|nr:RDD family protein [Brevibacillus ruminantium]USG67664.1 RDD family protein [Brevibacillus ruminantium]